MNNFLQMLTPQNIGQLRELFSRFGHFLSPENQAMVEGIITEVEKGDGKMDVDKIRQAAASISGQVQSAGVSVSDSGQVAPEDFAAAQAALHNQEHEYEDKYGDKYEGYDEYGEYGEYEDEFEDENVYRAHNYFD